MRISKPLFFRTAYAFQGERVSQKPIDLDFYHHIMMGSQEAKRSMLVSFVREDTELQKYQKECNFHK